MKQLRKQNRLDIIKHPYILNYLNETLVYLSPVYTIRLFLHCIFLVLLYFRIHNISEKIQGLIIGVLAVMGASELVSVCFELQISLLCNFFV